MYYFLVAFVLSIIFTLLVRQLARKLKIVDTPDKTRHLHFQPVPLLGGAAIFLAFWLVTACVLFYHPVYGIEILKTKLIWALAASVIIIIIGIVDDWKPVSAKIRLAVTAAAVLVAVAGGIGLQKITNPFGGFIQMSLIVGNVLVFLWLMGMMYTTKILDGLDGLATGVVAIGAIMIFFLTRTAKFYQPNVGLLALIFAGACLGFLLFNFHPAKIFLGEPGSLFIGFMLGILAVISGGKLATALLVMAVPVLDLARVIYTRIRHGRPVFEGDREHLHFKLLTFGLSERQAVVLFYFISALFGATTLFLQSTQKLLALLFLFIAMIAVGWRLNYHSE
jgi:UDP-GlcNAc:undecaprenyl-phosphate GlcNAc-1-phosphate transferase